MGVESGTEPELKGSLLFNGEMKLDIKNNNFHVLRTSRGEVAVMDFLKLCFYL